MVSAGEGKRRSIVVMSLLFSLQLLIHLDFVQRKEPSTCTLLLCYFLHLVEVHIDNLIDSFALVSFYLQFVSVMYD